MSIITLGMLKSSYVYEEIIDRMVLIPIPTNREYISPKEKNGYKDQVFSNNFTEMRVSKNGKNASKCIIYPEKNFL